MANMQSQIGRESVKTIPMKILVIEDDREAAGYLAKAFEESGHNAHVAGDGETGFALAETGNYDIAIPLNATPRSLGRYVPELAA